MPGVPPPTARRDVVPALLAAVAGALGGGGDAPHGVVLTAPTGAGKSHLLREFAARLTLPARVTLARRSEANHPFAVAAELLEVDLVSPTTDVLLSRVDELTTSQSLVLIVDDLQSADAESVRVLQELVTLDAPIVLVAGRQPQPVRTLLLMSGIGATVYALQESSEWHWASLRALCVLGVGVALLGWFVRVQLRDHEPLVDVRLFKNRAFLGDTVVLFTTQFGMLAMTLYASLYVQNLLGYSPVKAGFSALALVLPLMLGAQLAGRWYDRSGARRPLLLGLTVATIGTVAWALALPNLAYLSKVPGMALVGFGLGLVFSPVNTDALSRVSPDQRPQASGIVQTVRQLGGTLGVAVIGSIILARENPHAAPAARVGDVAHAMTYGFWFAAGVFAIGLLFSWRLLPGRHPALTRPFANDADVSLRLSSQEGGA